VIGKVAEVLASRALIQEKLPCSGSESLASPSVIEALILAFSGQQHSLYFYYEQYEL
jgi:hypothetical protein